MTSTTLDEGTVKKEENSESLRACRICLAWDEKLHDIHDSGLGDIYTDIIGTTWSPWDGFPQQVCLWCRATLLRAHALRTRSRTAQALLHHELQQQHVITDSFIRTIDRSLYKLTNNTFSDEATNNCALYHCVYHDTQESDSKDDIFIEDNIQKNHEDGTEDLKEFDLDCDVESITSDDFPIINRPNVNSRVSAQNKTDTDEFNDIFINTDTDAEIAIADLTVVATTLEPQTEKVKATKARKRPVKEKAGGKAKVKREAKRKNTNENTDKDEVKVRKRKPQKFTEKFSKEEEIKEFEEKYKVKLQFLTDEEMAKDMEERKNSESYQRAEYKCELCYKGYLTPTSYANHIKSHTEARGEHECRLCHWRYNSPGKLRDHVRYVHRVKFQCTVCDKVLTGPMERVKLHTAFHAGATFPCNYCDKTFPRKTSCWTHMRVSHPLENADIGTCELCGEIFTSRKGLKMHKTRSHREKTDQSLLCRKCRLQFDTREAFQRHKDLQPGQRCYNNKSACQKCGMLCASEEELILHKHEAHGVELFTCDSCNKSFLSKSSLSVHIDRLHLKIKRSRALGEYTSYAPMVSRHERKARACVCEVCGKAYTAMAYLREHQMKHTGVRPYKCTLCPRGFVNRTMLRTHVDVIHKRLRKWKCPECPKTFLHQSSVNVHRLIHTGKKTYMCSYCGKAFVQSGSLITHVKYVHLKVTPPPRNRSKKKNA